MVHISTMEGEGLAGTPQLRDKKSLDFSTWTEGVQMERDMNNEKHKFESY